jgi:hypothetical protein
MAERGIPQISKAGLAEDWAQWSLISLTACYLMWLVHIRPDMLPRQAGAGTSGAAGPAGTTAGPSAA